MPYLLTWSTYAAHPTTPHSEKLQSWRESLARCPPCHLDAPHRQAWTLYALHVRTNHIHIILDAPDPRTLVFAFEQ